MKTKLRISRPLTGSEEEDFRQFAGVVGKISGIKFNGTEFSGGGTAASRLKQWADDVDGLTVTDFGERPDLPEIGASYRSRNMLDPLPDPEVSKY